MVLVENLCPVGTGVKMLRDTWINTYHWIAGDRFNIARGILSKFSNHSEFFTGVSAVRPAACQISKRYENVMPNHAGSIFCEIFSDIKTARSPHPILPPGIYHLGYGEPACKYYLTKV